MWGSGIFANFVIGLVWITTKIECIMKKLTTMMMCAAMTMAMTACGDKAKTNDETQVEVDKEVVLTPEDMTETEQLKADLQAVMDQIRSAQSLQDIEAMNAPLDSALKAIGERVEASPELQQAIQELGDEYNFDKVMEMKMNELLQK